MASILVLSVVVGGLPGLQASTAAADDEHDGIRIVKQMDFAGAEGAIDMNFLFVDPARRLLLAASSQVFAEDDLVRVNLDTLEQIDHHIITRQFNGGPRLVPTHYEPALGRLLYVPGWSVTGGDLASTSCTTNCREGRRLMAVSATDPTDVVDHPLPTEIVNGIRGVAYRHDPDTGTGTLYMLEGPAFEFGDVSAPPTTAVGGVVPAVHAFTYNPTAEGAAGLVHRWSRQASGCYLPWSRRGERQGFGVTPDGVVYILCRGSESAQVGAGFPDIVPFVRVGEPGVLTIAVGDDPGRTDRFDAAVEFHPFPGGLRSGKTFVDHVTDRIVLNVSGFRRSLSFVFDARRRAWIGSAVLVRGGGDFTRSGGGAADPVRQRMYVLQGDQAIRTIDVGVLPVVVGSEHPQPIDVRRELAHEAFDPVHRRLFVPHLRDEQTGARRKLTIFEDRTPPLVPPPPADPDALTNDIDEEEATSVDRIGGATAYGARLHWAGGARSGSSEYVLDHPAWGGDEEGELQSRRPAEGDRGLLVGHVERLEFEGDRDRGESQARAVGVTFPSNDPTEPELRSHYDDVTGRLIEPFAGSAPNAEECAADAPDHDCLAYDALADRMAGREQATCRARGFDDDRPSDTQDGAAVACSQEGAEARAASSEAMTGLPLRIGYASSHATSRYDPARGVVTTVTSRAGGIELDVPGIGSLHIGEVRQSAETWANGRPGGADSHHEWSANSVRIANAAGKTEWACGTPGPDDEAGRCDHVAVVSAINQAFATKVTARGPRVDEDELVRGSPGGAQASVEKDPYAVENDRAINGDRRREAAGLELMIVNDAEEASRVIVQLAGVYAESRYRIGQAAAPIEPLGPASLVIELLDEAGEALAGGMFEVRAAGDLPDATHSDPATNGEDPGEDEAGGPDNGSGERDADGDGDSNGNGDDNGNGNGDGDGSFQSQSVDLDDAVDGVLGLDGELIDGAVCVTAEDGIGNCVFEDLEPGMYQVTQTAAPDGYFAAEPFTVDVHPGFDTALTFTNLRAVGGVEINLSDDGVPPEPLAGGEFALLAGGTEEVGRCTTGDEGTCGFADVPLDDYVVRQEAAPDGRLTTDDIPFTLDQPGQVAVLNIVNGFEGVEASFAAAPPMVEPVSFRPGPTPPQPVVHRTESAPRPQPRSGIGGLLSLPADLFGFIARRPFEAALIIGVWLLLAAPAYLAARRRSLVIAKGVM